MRVGMIEAGVKSPWDQYDDQEQALVARLIREWRLLRMQTGVHARIEIWFHPDRPVQMFQIRRKVLE